MNSQAFGHISAELLNNFLSPYVARSAQSRASSQLNIGTIPVDIINEEKTITVYAELPGVEKNQVDVDFFNNRLTIIADKQRPYDTILNVNEGEIMYGRMERQITLPICVTRKETVAVTFKNGVLKVKINKLIEEENKFSVKLD